MNHIIINKLSDLRKIIKQSIYISGEPILINEEINNNMWELTFSDELVKNIKVEDIVNFLSELLLQYRYQLSKIKNKQTAIFYFWFDEQALQLRFNIISGNNKTLPFGCKLNILNYPESIIEKFINLSRKIILEGCLFELLDSNECLFEDDFEDNFVLDVYKLKINLSKDRI